MGRQLPSGGFRWRDTDTTENALATLDSIRPLGGAGFTADPPARAGGAPRFLEPPVVADGTLVPVGLVVDYGVAVRACSVKARTGEPLDTVRRDRRGCVPVEHRNLSVAHRRRRGGRPRRRRRHAAPHEAAPSRPPGAGRRRVGGRATRGADHRRRAQARQL